MIHVFSIAVQNVAIATLLALLVWGVTRILKNPPVAHILWLLILVKLVTPPVVLFEFGKWRSSSVKLGDERAADPSSIVKKPILQGPQPPTSVSTRIPRDDLERNRLAEGSPASIARDNLHTAPHDVQPRLAFESTWNAIRLVLMWFWLGGAGLFALLAGVRIVRFHRMLTGTLPASQRLQSVADELASRIGLWRSPDVRVVESALAPLVWCTGRRAMVVLPLSLLSELNEHQTAMVLVHELAHLRRRDHWVRLVELAVSVLYWWNPLVWWVRRRLHSVEEQCCDAWVAWVYPDRNHDYAESLLKAAELVPHHTSLLVLASPFLHTHTLKARIEMILTNRSRRMASRGAAVCLALVAAVVIPAGIRGAAGSDGQTESTSTEAQTRAVAAPVAGAQGQDSAPPARPASGRNAVNERPIAKEYQPFQGSWGFEFYGSLKWPAKPKELQTWKWTVQGQEITWTRPGHEALKLSFTVDPGFTRESKKWPNDIELTFLNGPDKGQKCLGSFYWFAGGDTLWVSFRDPGAKGDRPTKMSFNGYDRQTVIAVHPANGQDKPPTATPATVPLAANQKPLAPELQVFQGTWNFGLFDSVLWYTDLDVIRKTWTWKFQGQEITWTRQGNEPVKMSFSIDPSKTPNQIDLTFLDGPDKGKKCRGIYEFERAIVRVCITEPGAKVDRPARMEMSSDSQTALIILEDKNVDRSVVAKKAEPPKAKPAPLPTVSAAKPIATGLDLLQGTFKMEKLRSDQWAAKPDEFHTWEWTIQGREILWTRPNQEPLKLSFTVDPAASPPQMDLTFLNGPDTGETCQGIYFAARHEISICFQNPGAKVGRPTNTGSKPGSQQTAITLVPAQILPVADEVQALQGVWKFDIYYSNWWPARINNPPISWSSWRWTIKGNEITWTGIKVPDVKLSFTVDPSKSPRQIDMTFLDGPHKGKKLLGMYEFRFEGGCDICFADPDAKVDRPTEVSYSGLMHQTMVSLEKLAAEKPIVDAAPAAGKSK